MMQSQLYELTAGRGKGLSEGLISVVFSSVTAVLSTNGPLVPLGALVSI